MDDHEEGDAPPVAECVGDHVSVGDGVAVNGREPALVPAAGFAGDGPRKPKRKRRRKRGRRVFVRDGEARPAQQIPIVPEPGAKAPVGALEAPRQTGGSVYTPSNGVNGASQTLYAALDLGTNNCRLLVATPGRPGRFRVVDAFSRIVRLGEGLTASGRLSQQAMDRAVDALAVCAEKLAGWRLSGVRMIATEACRSAENGGHFLDRVQRETGLALEVIDRRTEARLAVSGCSSLITRETDGLVLFDIGGGSSEIALIDLSRHRTPRLADHIVSWTSLPVGVVSLAERFGGRVVTPEIFEAMVEEVAVMLSRFDGGGRLAHVASTARFHLLGTSGTVTTLAGVHLGLKRYDRRRVDGLWMERDSVDRMIGTILGWSFDERKANPCIGSERADLVLAGCAILEAIRRHWPAERLRVADRGLREGMLSEMMARDGVWRRRKRAGAWPA
ncbi:Ppx/GppA phosphatase family protein [Chelativorans alearense]|uniref:Ppx/GppA phosphatase family protein n=1 Tax=Chelativorans alearense TaxID=2681495 RepID=UPI0013D4A9FC